jgi:RNA-directed DNA polymerase
MTKGSIDLQDLRRRIYVKAKAETSWKFWGLYVHVCKLETLREARLLADRLLPPQVAEMSCYSAD